MKQLGTQVPSSGDDMVASATNDADPTVSCILPILRKSLAYDMKIQLCGK
jgi:hypothetical protein